jgi:hydrogenase nickel incorporation protein HypB
MRPDARTMPPVRVIEVKKSVYASNDAAADGLRASLRTAGTFLVNLMASPGAGKTSLVLKLIDEFAGNTVVGVMEADIDSSVDAEAVAEAGVDAVQIHTDGMCHLDAGMTRRGAESPEMRGKDVVILENVGNLVCPAEFDTGAHANVMILSVPEGDDKPLKYPLMFTICDLLIIGKTDVADAFDFDASLAASRARALNPDIDVISVSARTGEGVVEVADWIRAAAREDRPPRITELRARD